MAPPKRKTSGGRVTAKGTRPGGHPTKSSKSSTSDEVANWQRAAPTSGAFRESKRWAPYVAGVMLGGGVIAIIAHNLLDTKSPYTVLGAIVALMIGMWALTKW